MSAHAATASAAAASSLILLREDIAGVAVLDSQPAADAQQPFRGDA